MKARSSVAFSLFAKLNFKLLIVGPELSGKTCLIHTFIKGVFPPRLPTSNGIEFYSSTLPIGSEEFALQIWDTAGAPRFHSIIISFYHQAHCVLIAYAQPETAKEIITKHLLEINQHSHSAVQIVIVRTKVDQHPMTNEEIDVLEDFVQKEENIMFWIKVCAKNNDNVAHLFKNTANALFAKYHEDEAFKQLVDPKKDSFVLSPKMVEEQKARKRGCCS